jgi:radical SAM-linked protein
MTKTRKLRLWFAKRGVLRLISHHDLMRCVERMARRAEIPLATSQGFTPRPKIVFALALGLGIEGHREVVDFELSEPKSPAEVLAALAAQAPAGFEWLDGQPLAPEATAPRPVAAAYRFEVPAPRRDQARNAVAALLASSSWPLVRRRPDRGKELTLDLRSFLLDAELNAEGSLQARLRITPEGSARPEELLEALGLRDLLDRGGVLARTHVELA